MLAVRHACRKLRSDGCVVQADTGLHLCCAALRVNMRAYIKNNGMQFSALLCAASPVSPASQCAPGLILVLSWSDIARFTIKRR